MKKFLVVVVALVIGYLLAGVVAWRVVPGKIAEAERKREGVSLAHAKIAGDQLAVSKRISEITAQTLDAGRDKATQVAAFLADPALNRMALVYTGADWAAVRSTFVGSVGHLRDQQRKLSQDGKKQSDLLDDRIRNLEMRKAQLLNRSIPPRVTNKGADVYGHVRAQWEKEVSDIDRQLSSLRDNGRYAERLEKAATGKRKDPKVESETALYNLAVEYETRYVQELVRRMAGQAADLDGASDEVGPLKAILSYFDIWPLNRLAKTSTGA